MKKFLILLCCLTFPIFALEGSEEIRMEKLFDLLREKHLRKYTPEIQGTMIDKSILAIDNYIRRARPTQEKSLVYLKYLLCQEKALQISIPCEMPYHVPSLLTENVDILPLSELRTLLTQEHNKRRINRNLNTLSPSLTLHTIAQDYAHKLCKAGEISHTLNGSTLELRYDNGGYEYKTGGENLAQGQETIMETLDQLTTSIYHRENMFQPLFTEIGIGYCDNIWVINYGTPTP